jgi:hypothetical protein
LLTLGITSVAALGGLSCERPDAAPTPPHSTGNMIGPAGGIVRTSDQEAGVDIPEGALLQDTIITIKATDAPQVPAELAVVGGAYAFEPEGLAFAVPVTVILPYAAENIPAGRSAKDIVVYGSPAGRTAFSALSAALEDDGRVRVETSHFSDYFPGLPAVGAPCNSDADCPPACVAGLEVTLACVAGGCTPTSWKACPEGTACAGSACVPDATLRCASADDCLGMGSACDGNLASRPACVADTCQSVQEDCAASDKVCSGGACVPAACKVQSDCGTPACAGASTYLQNYICAGGVCESGLFDCAPPNGKGVCSGGQCYEPCQTDAECLDYFGSADNLCAGDVAMHPVCTPAGLCEEFPEDCAAYGEVCSAGACVPAACKVHSDCGTPACAGASTYLQNYICAGGVCESELFDCAPPDGKGVCSDGHCWASCQTDAECLAYYATAGELCSGDVALHPVCTPAGICEEFPEDCAVYGETCVSGTCLANQCSDTKKCPDGSICVSGSCQAAPQFWLVISHQGGNGTLTSSATATACDFSSVSNFAPGTGEEMADGTLVDPGTYAVSASTADASSSGALTIEFNSLSGGGWDLVLHAMGQGGSGTVCDPANPAFVAGAISQVGLGFRIETDLDPSVAASTYEMTLECTDASINSGAYAAAHGGMLNGQYCYVFSEPGAAEKYTMPFSIGASGSTYGSIGSGAGGFTGSSQLDGWVHITVKPKGP